ncbi:FliI/YscN family ATPase [Parasulfitobacter algicola]|uniref:FliI/YscN family ATPase n=1 Tax=Parasulfitobacter algicola TaxID=2614809 RepID=A0ABX2IQP5_9RHOB|nr:FliI/YscN family ATPase [Sulfitobacter algicola]NSX54680.1 FliI/YscN family ATPase [Sulfitobacter algicola]
MSTIDFDCLKAEIAQLSPTRRIGRVSSVYGGVIEVEGLSDEGRLGDQTEIMTSDGIVSGEVLQLRPETLAILPDHDPVGVAIGDTVHLNGQAGLAPHDGWIGRVIDPFGKPLDGKPLLRGPEARNLRSAPPEPTKRRSFGGRLETGLTAFNTMLPIVSGQRIGLFAGSGVGKSTLLSQLARGLEADVVVIALVGERGREVGEFIQNVLGPDGMKRSVVVAATSDRSPLVRRRCAWAAMTVAEHFRDQGNSVLFLADSITRFAEAHREIALASGEAASLRGFPASTSQAIMSLCERAGPGQDDQGDITAVLSVLVAGSDMDEPIADITRGVLDGHVVLDREIAERGRFPAVDLLRSVSRSLPHAANPEENQVIEEFRRLMGTYQRSEMMIKAGLYAAGSDPELDRAIRLWPRLDAFLSEHEEADTAASFYRLAEIMGRTSLFPAPEIPDNPEDESVANPA